MTRFKLAFAIAAALASTASYADSPNEALAAFHTALSTGSKEKALERLSPQVVIYESGYVERSRDEYVHHHLEHDIAFAKTATRKVINQAERIYSNFAVLTAETETVGKIQGKEVSLTGTETAVLEKNGESWLITHLHWSSRKPQPIQDNSTTKQKK